MTDMRATERLLEVIGEQVPMIEHVAFDHDPMLVPKLEPYLTAIRFMLLELRGRGDTLVRRHDLLRAFQCASEYVREYEGLESTASDMGDVLTRLENAIGGKP